MTLENQNSPHAEGIKKAILNKAGSVSFMQKMHLCLSKRAGRCQPCFTQPSSPWPGSKFLQICLL